MGVMSEHELAGLGFANKDSKSDITKFALEHLGSEAENKVIQNTEFGKEDIYWVTALEILDSLIIRRYCFDVEKRNIVRNLKNRFYLSRISLGRQGRKEITEILKNEVNFMGMMPNTNQELK